MASVLGTASPTRAWNLAGTFLCVFCVRRSVHAVFSSVLVKLDPEVILMARFVGIASPGASDNAATSNPAVRAKGTYLIMDGYPDLSCRPPPCMENAEIGRAVSFGAANVARRDAATAGD